MCTETDEEQSYPLVLRAVASRQLLGSDTLTYLLLKRKNEMSEW